MNDEWFTPYGDRVIVIQVVDDCLEGLLPPGPFDCFVVATNKMVDEALLHNCAHELVVHESQWIEVFGEGAELIHDTIDAESVRVGRQAKRGEGNPMTTWFPGVIDPADLASYVVAGGQGTSHSKLLLLIGDGEVVSSLILQVDRRCHGSASDHTPHGDAI
jgi:hypothetical protein